MARYGSRIAPALFAKVCWRLSSGQSVLKPNRADDTPDGEGESEHHVILDPAKAHSIICIYNLSTNCQSSENTILPIYSTAMRSSTSSNTHDGS